MGFDSRAGVSRLIPFRALRNDCKKIVLNFDVETSLPGWRFPPIMPLSTENEIQRYYSAGKVTADYVQNRFVSEVHRLLHESQVAAVQRAFEKVRPARALEIAPGPGRITRAVRPTGKLLCLEFNEGMIREGARACTPEKIWVRGNGFHLPFPQDFDLLYTFRFVRHFHREDR